MHLEMKASNTQLFKNIATALGDTLENGITNIQRTTLQITTQPFLQPVLKEIEKEKEREKAVERELLLTSTEPYYLKKVRERVKFSQKPKELKIIEKKVRHSGGLPNSNYD